MEKRMEEEGFAEGSAGAWLLGTAGVSLRGMGDGDRRVDSGTEAAMSRLFDRYMCGECTGGLVRWNADGTVCVYDGRVFAKRKAEYLQWLIKAVMERSGVGEVYVANSVGKIWNRCMKNVQFGGHGFRADRRWAAFGNCVLELATGETRDFSAEYATDIVMGFDYDPAARSALWESFIVQTIPSEDMRRAFQMFCGAFFVDRREVKIELACYLIGSGRNGKSVAVSAISDTLGADMVSFFSPQQLFTETTCMYNRANADGKLANFSDDVKATDYSGGDFKQFVSGKPFEARRIRQEPYTMRSVPFMVLCVNAMPPTTDDSDGHYRRVLPIICPNKVSERDADPMLEEKLRSAENRQAIFNWMYEGYRMLMANGGKIPKGSNIEEVQEELKADSNSARRWIRDMGFRPCEPSGNVDERWVSFKKIMEDYRKYCADMAENVKSQKSVAMILKELGFAMRRTGTGMMYCIEQEYAAPADEEMPF